MEPRDRAKLEEDVRAACTAGDFVAAATLALRGYGPEILGFLTATHASEAEADEVFAELSEVLWRKLPSFAWDSSLRTWSYALARNVSRTYRRDAGRRHRRSPSASDSQIDAVVAGVRTETQTYLRSSARARLERVRRELSDEDRALLVLRVDRGLEWGEVARVLLEDESPDAVALAREAARLRKRFQLVKERIRARFAEEGDDVSGGKP